MSKGDKMLVTQTLSQGLKREFKVVFPASDLAQRLEGQLAEMKDKVRINGFRPGKVPVAHLKRVYGKSIMGDVVQNAVSEANKKIVEEHGLRLAQEPKIDFPEDQAEVERVLEATGDLSFTINVETLPAFEVGSFEDVEITRPVAPVSEDEVEQGLRRLADRNRVYTPAEGEVAAEAGDRVTVDFVGRLNGEVFEGGEGKGIDVTIGSGTFIPGFEEQLTGIRAGEQRLVKVTFPDNYSEAKLAGQPAEFDVTATAVAKPGALAIDEAFAKGFGFDSVEALRAAIRGNLEGEHAKQSRDKLKRALLDALDKKYSFELPEGLVGMEFENVWRQVSSDQASSGRTFEQDGSSEAEARAEYRRIAERRVRLGLLLAEVGDKAGVEVKDDEVTAALVERARAYPGQEKMVWDYYSKNQQALAEIRAPLFEEKVIDHIFGLAKVHEAQVTREELFKVEEE